MIGVKSMYSHTLTQLVSMFNTNMTILCVCPTQMVLVIPVSRHVVSKDVKLSIVQLSAFAHEDSNLVPTEDHVSILTNV